MRIFIKKLNIRKDTATDKIRFYSKEAASTKKENSVINYKMVLGLKKIEISNLSSLCRDFHNIFRIDKYQLLKYANDILPFIKYLRTSEIVMILHHYSFINYTNKQFYDTVWKSVIHRLHDIDCKELALIIYSMGKIKYANNEHMLSFFRNEIKKWIHKFSGRDCSLILKGMQDMNIDVERHNSNDSNNSNDNAYNSNGVYNSNDAYNVNDANEKIYNLLYDRVVDISNELNILDICIILNAHSKYKNINARLFEMLLNKSLTFFSKLNFQCIGTLLWSTSNANVKAERYFHLLGLKLRLLMQQMFSNSSKGETDNVKSENSESMESGITNKHHMGSPKSMDDFDDSYFQITETKDDTKELFSISKYSKFLPAIIYSYGKQKGYMKHNIHIDKNMYNDIIATFSPELEFNTFPKETVQLFDASKQISSAKNIFGNLHMEHRSVGESGNMKAVLKKKQKQNLINKKYYQHITYIVNNYLPFFLNHIHYNDIKNILFGITKMEISVNKSLLKEIYAITLSNIKKNMYKDFEIVNLAKTLSTVPYEDKSIWKNLITVYETNYINTTTVQNNCYMFYIISFVEHVCDNSHFLSSLTESINKKMPKLAKMDVIHLVKGLINLNFYPQELVNRIMNYIQKNYTLFNLIDIVYILKYCTLMNLRNTEIFTLFACTIKRDYVKKNFQLISTIAAFYLQMEIYPESIRDILIEEKKNRERNFATEEIRSDDL